MSGMLITQMAEFHDQDETAFWNVIINCSGGTTESGSAVYSQLLAYAERGNGTHYVTTIATGQCSSMATLIAQAGDWRVTDELCVWMFHEPNTGVFESNLTNISDDINMLKQWNDIADDKTIERTTLTRQQYQRKIKGRNWFAMSKELLELGFVDEVR
jgi:ATP-dependent protease ClpP protease subunit